MKFSWLLLAAVALVPGVSFAERPAPPQRRDHPDPRVIVDVLSVNGPHKRGELEREARRALWGKIIGCYLPSAAKKPGLRGEATLKFRVSARGDVGAVRPEGSTFGDAEIVTCLQQLVAGLTMPRAAADSDAAMQIHVAPGDPPGAARAPLPPW
jgi:hypothetical protein